MSKPRLLDLFCGAGGAARGYMDAGFHVTGVDINPQPHYCGDEFIQADAMTFPLNGYDAIHASPPCQAYGSFANLNRERWGTESRFPKMIEAVRDRCTAAGVPYVIENTERAPMVEPTKLCGSSFGLKVRRHRLFETSFFIFGSPRCVHWGWEFVGVFGKHPGITFNGSDGYERVRRADSLIEAQKAMGIDWMTWDELREAIPPAYTRFIGEQLMQVLHRTTVSEAPVRAGLVTEPGKR